MAEAHLIKNDKGTEIPFDSNEWVSATKTRNFVANDPLLDWLNIHGKSKGFKKDNEHLSYDKNLEFTEFLFKQGHLFESAAVSYLQDKFGSENFATVCNDYKDSRDLAKAKETFKLMKSGKPFILQGVLWNPENRTFGMPDILVRSDWLNKITEQESISSTQEKVKAPDLDGEFHYRVVDVKFTTIKFNASNSQILNDAAQKAYKSQLVIYNKALHRIQGYKPPKAYLLSKNWKYTQRGKDYKGEHSLQRLAAVDFLDVDSEFYQDTEDAIQWYRRVRSEGASWDVFPSPSRQELWPNCKNDKSYPWTNAKSKISKKIKDLTLIKGVSLKHREKAHSNHIFTTDDERLNPQTLGITTEKTSKRVKALIDINRDSNLEKVYPPKIEKDTGYWKKKPKLEFFVDFETVNNIDDDFSKFPYFNSDSQIFMIGCGHEDIDGNWQVTVFTADVLNLQEENRIIKEWLSHMQKVSDQILGEGASIPRIYHWSAAEVSVMRAACKNQEKIGGSVPSNWTNLPWFDFLPIVRDQPFVVKGAFGFGLKAIAKNMYKHNLIETSWGDGPADGLGAMVGAWYCNKLSQETGKSMKDMNYMAEIEEYNIVDCKVMWEIINYLREHHS